ncbi:chromate transporter [Methylovirgula sp. HY1]|uniref:chromate transporter n=1 Tax=Methylovirgula sp. HY1 TaxID=2822761 RepID=UPI001C5ADD57|nr:chromate transporter [Methylovirgula sp. HY1]QXX73915.1 Chromate transport protein [Methylovirgula sp. HY1]
MKAQLLVEIARIFSGISLVAIGGANAAVPEIRRQVVGHLHWMNDQTFANLIGLAQAAPGPNVIVVSMIGWYMAGLMGLAVATLAMVLPSSCLALFVGRIVRQRTESRFWQLARKVLAPIAVGLILASGAVMARAADHSALTVAATLGMTSVVFWTRLNPLLGIVAGAILGVAAGRFGLAVF